MAGEITLPKSYRPAVNDRIKFSTPLSVELPQVTSLQSVPLTARHVTTAGGKTALQRDVFLPLPENTTVALPKGTKIVFPAGCSIGADRGQLVTIRDKRLACKRRRKLEFSAEELGKDILIELPRSSIIRTPRQFARTPFFVAFQAGWLRLNLCTVHIYFGKGRAGLDRRLTEIKNLTKFLGDRATKENEADAESCFVALGDFNIVSKTDDMMKALEDNGFRVPSALRRMPGSNVRKNKSYDQIAIWENPVRSPYTRVAVSRAGIFDFFEIVYRKGWDDDLYDGQTGNMSFEQWRTYQMSDHLPMWVEIRTDLGEEYLREMRGDTQ